MSKARVIRLAFLSPEISLRILEGNAPDGVTYKALKFAGEIPLAWAMMSYPALLAARRLVRGTLTTAIVGAVALASWDLFLDPQMVGEGHWTWSLDRTPVLVGIPDVPLQNFVAWLLVSLVLMLVLGLLPRRRNDGAEGDGVPALLYLWTYFSSIALSSSQRIMSSDIEVIATPYPASHPTYEPRKNLKAEIERIHLGDFPISSSINNIEPCIG